MLSFLCKGYFFTVSYQFLIKEHEPFVLSDMKIIMKAQFTMYSEGYGCTLGEYKINGIIKDGANPDFRKKGFKFPWEE